MGERSFKVSKCYYDMDHNLYNTDYFTLKPGLTVLVGCNGSGKTTLIRQMKADLDGRNIPYVSFNNLTDGGTTAKEAALLRDDFEFLATSFCSSEGENIIISLGNVAREIGGYVKKNNDRDELWVFLDAIDSGLSIDNVNDVKRYLFDAIFETTQGKDVYIIVSANSFEFAAGEQCLDVWSAKYVAFEDYADYKNFIMKSRARKDKRG